MPTSLAFTKVAHRDAWVLACAHVALFGAILPQLAAARSITVGQGAYPDLPSALAAVPGLRAGLPAGEGLDIVLPPGARHLAHAIEIDAAHSGTPDHPLRILGAADGTTRFVGTVALSPRHATPADADGATLAPGVMALDLAGQPVLANLVRRGLYVHPATAGLMLFQGSERMTPSRWPAQSYATATPSGTLRQGPSITLPPERAAAMVHEKALWLGGFWAYDWAYELAPVAHVDGDGRLTMQPMQGEQEPGKSARYFLANSLADLKAPGSFYVDPDRKLALFIPLATGGPVELAVAPGLLTLKGAHDLTVQNVAFDRALGSTVVADAASKVRFVHCAMRQAGVNGAVVNGGQDVGFDHSVIADTGETGIVLSGGDRASLKPARHFFANGLITGFSRESLSYRPGASLFGVGNEVRGSVITGSGHNAVMLAGNDHAVIDNEIADVLRDTEDAGAIYMGKDWTMRGNRITGNYIHDLGRHDRGGGRPTVFLSAVYLDDQFSSAEIRDNVLVGADFGVVIGGGRDNLVEHNLIVQPSRAAVQFDERGQAWQKGLQPQLVAMLAHVPYKSPPWSLRYPALAALEPQDYGHAQGNALRDNTVLGAPLLLKTPQDLATTPTMTANLVQPALTGQMDDATSAAVTAVFAHTWPALHDRRKGMADLIAMQQVPADSH